MTVPSKKPDTWMPVYPAAYLANTSHLNTTQHGAYWLLLLHGWKHSGRLPLPECQLQQITRMTDRQWKDSRTTLLAFFDKDEFGYTQKRQLEEIEKATKLTAAKSVAGKAGAEKRWHANGKEHGKQDSKPIAEPLAEGMANACRDDAPLPLPIPKTKAESKPSAQALRFAPPDWIPRQEWDDFDEMRRAKSGKGWTFKARELAVKELEKLRDMGEDVGAVLRQSVLRTWAGLFPVEQQARRPADKRSATAKAMYGKQNVRTDDTIDGDAERVD